MCAIFGARTGQIIYMRQVHTNLYLIDEYIFYLFFILASVVCDAFGMGVAILYFCLYVLYVLGSTTGPAMQQSYRLYVLYGDTTALWSTMDFWLVTMVFQ